SNPRVGSHQDKTQHPPARTIAPFCIADLGAGLKPQRCMAKPTEGAGDGLTGVPWSVVKDHSSPLSSSRTLIRPSLGLLVILTKEGSVLRRGQGETDPSANSG